MIKPISYEQSSELRDASAFQIKDHIIRLTLSELAGFTITQTRKSYKQACSVAQSLGFEGDTKAAVPFEHNERVGEAVDLIKNGQPLNGQWRDYGVTQLHADGDANDKMLSAINVKKGSLEIRVFDRGPDIQGIDAVDLFDELEEETQRVLVEEKVDVNIITPEATVLRASKGDTIIFNPSLPHMAITLQGPRYSESTFFQ